MQLRQRVFLGVLVGGLLLVGAVDVLGHRGGTVTTTVSAGIGAGEGAAGLPAASTTVPAVAAANQVVSENVDEDPTATPLKAKQDSPPAPPTLPAKSGTGRRIVYTVKGHRVWLVDDANHVVRTMLVTNRKFVPNPGTYHVFGKAVHTQSSVFPEIKMDYMTRFAISPNRHNTIGFHAIPFKHGVPMQTVAQLGSYGSGGCVRMAPADAQYVFNWAGMGTKVVVLI